MEAEILEIQGLGLSAAVLQASIDNDGRPMAPVVFCRPVADSITIVAQSQSREKMAERQNGRADRYGRPEQPHHGAAEN
ncbi:MAG: hypothetical protein ABI192_10195 [Bradyrhizobium sp.]